MKYIFLFFIFIIILTVGFISIFPGTITFFTEIRIENSSKDYPSISKDLIEFAMNNDFNCDNKSLSNNKPEYRIQNFCTGDHGTLGIEIDNNDILIKYYISESHTMFYLFLNKNPPDFYLKTQKNLEYFLADYKGTYNIKTSYEYY